MTKTKERLLIFLKEIGIGQKKFEDSIGMSNGWVNKVGDSIRENSLQKIKDVYPELNIAWLISGVGDMLNETKSNYTELNSNEKEKTTATIIPLLPIAAQGGRLNDFIASVKDNDCEFVVSPIKDADFAISVSGDSMSPEYPNGSQILIKKIDEEAFIEWGKVYVLDTCNGTVVKILVPSEKDNFVKCLSINQDPIYAPFEIDKKCIFGIYRVLLCMSIK